VLTQLSTPKYGGFYSIHVRLLPFLDQRPLYDSINFDSGTWSTDSFDTYLTPERLAANAPNGTARTTSVGVFLCPSDGGTFGRTGNNYRGNTGVGGYWGTTAEHPDSANGIFPEVGPIRMGFVTDGLSHTVAVSERLRGSGSGGAVAPDRDVFRMGAVAMTADDLLQACQIAARPQSVGYTSTGKWWFWTGREYTLYSHTQSPNGRIPDCAYGNSIPATDMATARSRHPGGVNALMGDGSTRFVAETISTAVWRGLGTRNGRELVD
jgi:prepilin-type processing-associated H-X9-DG protein